MKEQVKPIKTIILSKDTWTTTGIRDWQRLTSKYLRERKIGDKHLIKSIQKNDDKKIRTSPENITILAQLKGKSIGALDLFVNRDKVEINWIYVLPQYRKLGVGSKLLTKAYYLARMAGVKNIYLRPIVSKDGAGLDNWRIKQENAWSKIPSNRFMKLNDFLQEIASKIKKNKLK